MSTNSIFVNLKNLETKINKKDKLLIILVLFLQHYFKLDMQKNAL